MSNSERVDNLKKRLTTLLSSAREQVKLGPPSPGLRGSSYKEFSEKLFRYTTSNDIVTTIEDTLKRYFGTSDLDGLSPDLFEMLAASLNKSVEAIFTDLEVLAKACEDTQNMSAEQALLGARDQEPIS